MKEALRKLLTARPVRSVLRALPLPEVAYRSLHFKDSITVPLRVANGSFNCVHYGYQVENDIYWAGFANNWEGPELRVWLNLCKRSKVICDIGANTGIFSLAAGAVNRSATILAFEPMPRIVQKLERNVALNPFDITVFGIALTDSDGEMTFFEPDAEHAYSATLDPDMAKEVGAILERKVQVRRFDTVLEEQGLQSVDLIKLDAEMHEPEVLAGFGKIIDQMRPIFLMEVLSEELGSRVWANFEGKDYAFKAINETGLSNAETLGAVERNYLIFPVERSAEIERAGAA